MEQKVDGFRFMTGLHTTTRILSICSAIVKIVGQKQLPLNLVKQLSIEWSRTAENTDKEYRLRKGKLTDMKPNAESKATTALEHYIQLLQSMGLLHRTGPIITTTRLATVLNGVGGDDSSFTALSQAQKIFFFIHLFYLDADALLLTMSLLYNKGPQSQKAVLGSFKDEMLQRVSIKAQFAASHTAQISIRDWYMRITTQWENPGKYAEHLLVPRLEWLHDLGVVESRKIGSQSTYTLTPEGVVFFESIPLLNETKIRDIDDEWLKWNLVHHCVKLTQSASASGIRKLADLPEDRKSELMKGLLLDAFKTIDTSGAMRIALYPSYIYMNITGLLHQSIYFEFNELTAYLKVPLTINNKKYFAKEASRTTESYITITI